MSGRMGTDGRKPWYKAISRRREVLLQSAVRLY